MKTEDLRTIIKILNFWGLFPLFSFKSKEYVYSKLFKFYAMSLFILYNVIATISSLERIKHIYIVGDPTVLLLHTVKQISLAFVVSTIIFNNVFLKTSSFKKLFRNLSLTEKKLNIVYYSENRKSIFLTLAFIHVYSISYTLCDILIWGYLTNYFRQLYFLFDYILTYFISMIVMFSFYVTSIIKTNFYMLNINLMEMKKRILFNKFKNVIFYTDTKINLYNKIAFIRKIYNELYHIVQLYNKSFGWINLLVAYTTVIAVLSHTEGMILCDPSLYKTHEFAIIICGYSLGIIIYMVRLF